MASALDLIDNEGKPRNALELIEEEIPASSTYSFIHSKTSMPYKSFVDEAEIKHGLPRNLLPRLIQQESGFNPEALSPKGAEGIMQIMPKEHPGINTKDPRTAIDYGAGYLKKLYTQLGSWDKALAAYNAGPGRVAEGKLPPETIDYVKRISGGTVGGGGGNGAGKSAIDLINEPLIKSPTIIKPVPPTRVYKGIAPPGGYNENGQPLNSLGIPYPIVSPHGRGMHNVAMLSPLAGMASVSSIQPRPTSSGGGSSIPKTSVGKGLLKGTLSLPITAINTAAGFMSWPAPLSAGLGTYIDRLIETGDPDFAKKEADKIVETISRYMPRLPNTEEGMAQEELLLSVLGWPKLASKWLADASGLSKVAKIPGKAGQVIDYLSEQASDFLSAIATMKAGTPISAGIKLGAEYLNKKATKNDLAIRGAEVSEIKGGNLKDRIAAAKERLDEIKFNENAREAGKAQYIMNKEIVSENLAGQKVVEKKVTEKGTKIAPVATEAIDISTPDATFTTKKGVEYFKVGESWYNKDGAPVKNKIILGAAERSIEKAGKKVVEEPAKSAVELIDKDGEVKVEPKPEPLPLTEENMIEHLKSLGYEEVDAKEMVKYDLESKALNEFDLDYKNAKGEWKSKPVENMDEYKAYLEGLESEKIPEKAKEPYTEIDEQIGTPEPKGLSTHESPFREKNSEYTEELAQQYSEKMNSVKSDPEVMTSYLINQVNRWLDGKDVDIKAVRKQLSEMATRSDELRGIFEAPDDFLIWKDTISDAADWARKSDRPKNEQTGGTRLGTMIPVDQMPQMVLDTMKNLGHVFGGAVQAGKLYRNKQLFDETGFWYGKDDKWRYELDSNKVKIKHPDAAPNMNHGIESIIDFPELYNSIPSMRDIKINIDPSMNKGSGYYEQHNRRIKVQSLHYRDLFFHELQHAANAEMGSRFLGANYGLAQERASLLVLADRLTPLVHFAKNDTIKQFAQKIIDELKEYSDSSTPYDMPKIYKEWLHTEAIPWFERQGATDIVNQLKFPVGETKVGRDNYMKNEGEIEARLAAVRDELPASYKKDHPPWETLDTMLDIEGYKGEGHRLYSGIPIDKIVDTVRKLRVWHGSNKDLKVLHPLETAPFRTGEGGMARGAGLYVSEEMGVGRSYADMGTPGEFKFNKPFKFIDPLDVSYTYSKYRDGTIKFDEFKHGIVEHLEYAERRISDRIAMARGEEGLYDQRNKILKAEDDLKDVRHDLSNITKSKESDFSIEGSTRHLHELEVSADAKWLDWDKPLKDHLTEKDIKELQDKAGAQYYADVDANKRTASATLQSNPYYKDLLSNGRQVANQIVMRMAEHPEDINNIKQEWIIELSKHETGRGLIHDSDVKPLTDLIVNLDRSDVSGYLPKIREFVESEGVKLSESGKDTISRFMTKLGDLRTRSFESRKNELKQYLDNYNTSPRLKALTGVERSEARRLINAVKEGDILNKVSINEDFTGGEVYRLLDRALAAKNETAAGDVEASKFLRDLGYAGNRFKGISGDKPYSNYVVFAPEKHVKVTKTNLYSGIPIDEIANTILSSAKKVIAYTDKAVGMKAFKPIKSAILLKEELKREFIDRAGNIRVDLLDKLGKEGYDIVQKMYLSKGASALAASNLKQMRKEVYGGLSRNEKKVLDRIILVDRMLDIAKYKDPKQFKFPEGLGPIESTSYRETFDIVEKLPPERAEVLRQRAEGYFEWMKKPLKDMLDAELITQTEYDNLASHNYRRIKLVEIYDKRQPNIGKRARTVYDSGVESLSRGRDTDIYEPSSEVMALEVFNRAYGRIMNNAANKALLDLAERDPSNSFVKTKVSKEDTNAQATALREKLTSEGKSEEHINTEVDKLLKLGKIPSGWNRIFVFDKGKRKSIYLSPEMGKEWITNSPEISYKLSRFLRYTSGAPILRTFATGINWAFALANLPRDIMHIQYAARAWEDGKWKPVYNPTYPVYAMQMGRDLGSVFGDALLRKGRYDEYIKEGGGMEFLVHQGRLLQKGRHIEGGVINKIENLLGYFGETSEILTRLAIRERALRQGKSAQEATFIARDYMDFGQGGGVAKALDNAVPYLNAAIQGTRGMWRAMAENPVSSSYKLAQFSALTAGITVAMWKLSPESAKSLQGNVANQNNLCIPLGDSFGFEDEKGQMRYPFFKVPLDPAQRFFKTFFEGATNKWLGNPVDSDSIVGALSSTSPVGVTQLPPTVAGTLGYVMNKNFWLNEDIWKKTDKPFSWPQSKEESIPGQTPQAFIDLGKFTGLSPERTKYAVEQLVTGGSEVGYLLGQGYDAVFSDLPKKEREFHLAEVLSKTPVIKRFIGVTNPYSQFAKGIEEAAQESAVKKFVQDRGLDLRAEGYLFYKNTSPGEINEYMNSFKDKDVYNRLKERFDYQVAIKDLPNRSFWLRLKGLDTDARAKVYYDRLESANAEERAQLMKEEAIVKHAGGVITEEFKQEVMKRRLGN
jgi:hypothetical protein